MQTVNSFRRDENKRRNQRLRRPSREIGKMKQRIKFLGITAAAALAGSVASAQEFRLNFGHYLSNSPFVEVEQEFVQRVQERTDGRVAINIVYSGGLGGESELLGLVGR